jgi:hypothetical protein
MYRISVNRLNYYSILFKKKVEKVGGQSPVFIPELKREAFSPNEWTLEMDCRGSP